MRVPPDVSVCDGALMNKASQSNHGACIHSQTPPKNSLHPSLHLLQLDKISRLCSAVSLIGRGGEKQAFDTNTGSAFTYLGACLSADVNVKEV